MNNDKALELFSDINNDEKKQEIKSSIYDPNDLFPTMKIDNKKEIKSLIYNPNDLFPIMNIDDKKEIK
uniref:Uncharacterized protein n=1 Tax=viral metagenome TaxID=1070528 RepID=A0A6C0H4Z7_9ZZZZ